MQKLAKKKNATKETQENREQRFVKGKDSANQIVVSVVFDSVSLKKKKSFNNVGIHQANFIDTIMGWGRR
jgi:hypothetical protein